MKELGQTDETPGGVVKPSSEAASNGGGLPEEKRCRHVFPDGRRCRAARMKGKQWCFFHDPADRWPESAPALISVSELRAVLARTLHDLRQKRVSPGEAYAIGYLVQLLSQLLGKAQEEYSLAVGDADLHQAIDQSVKKAVEEALDAPADTP